ncbi:hypothetical protein JL100_030420 (plasmid) [Skermanella mucosa]|uniref:hypothetical protein n=1 Tax=Skermanella mucosa TaxID=1789672 RepID=UPI00192B20FE|nr:hypothetical protein [Skermanella mucosa]UEM24540.1 hypothetical protein JL100_030420 [Skermanella mucosa]
MGRELSDEFGFDAGDPDALDDFVGGIHDSEVQGAYSDREPDLVTADGAELFVPDDDHDQYATHVIEGKRYIQRGPHGVPTERPHVISFEGVLYSRVPLIDGYGDEKPGRVDLEWDGLDWYQLDAERMKADCVKFLAGYLDAPRGLDVAEADYALSKGA